jgi:hypothetical protein
MPLLQKMILDITRGGQPGAPRAEAWIGASNVSNADQSNVCSIPIQKPALPVTAHQSVDERRLRQVTTRHRRIILSGINPENQIPHFCKALQQLHSAPQKILNLQSRNRLLPRLKMQPSHTPLFG